jgi:hypothetical protein
MDVQTNQKLERVPDRMDMHIPSCIILKQILRAILLRVHHAILDPCWNATITQIEPTETAEVLKLGLNPITHSRRLLDKLFERSRQPVQNLISQL